MSIEKDMSAAEAIDLSEREYRIVFLPWSQELANELLAACEGDVDASETSHEYWGESWRVHLLKEAGGSR